MSRMREIKGTHIFTARNSEYIHNNVIESRKRNIPLVEDMPEWRDHPIAIVGGGPSLNDNLAQLSKYRYILACGSVHDYLIRQGIYPTWCGLVDPDPIVNNYLQEASDRVTYLVASQCAQEVFDRLKYFKVYRWNAGGGDDRYFLPGEILVSGGCTIGTRGMVLAMCMGFRHLHLYGMDTCVRDNGEHHAYGEYVDPVNETHGSIHTIEVGEERKKFLVADYMVGQLFDFKNMLVMYANKLEITVFGDGLLAYVMEDAKRRLKELEDGNTLKSSGPRYPSTTRT